MASREDFSRTGRERAEIIDVGSFRLSGRVDTDSPDAIEPVLRKVVRGKVSREGDGFELEAEMEGASAKELNRELLSALRRVEKRTRLRAEWTSGGTTERYFDYVLKKKTKG